MKTKVFTLAALLCCASAMYAQESGYKFTTVASQKATPVKNQASTGTCWCFATTSFMESELLRIWAKGNMIFLKCSLYAKST